MMHDVENTLFNSANDKYDKFKILYTNNMEDPQWITIRNAHGLWKNDTKKAE